MRVAIVGGGISGMAAAYECARRSVDYTLFESTARLGGTVETAHVSLPGCGDFTVELGPDGWVSEKPWLADLATELGLQDEFTPSNDSERRTWLLRDGELLPIPRNLRMMVPLDVEHLEESALLSAEAIAAFRAEPARAAELKAAATARGDADFSVAEFVRSHFGDEVTRTLAAPLLAGIFGGDIERLSARSVMPAFVRMEEQHGSLISALRSQVSRGQQRSIFTTLSGGLAQIVKAIEKSLVASKVCRSCRVASIARSGASWRVGTDNNEEFDAVVLATPAHVSRQLLSTVSQELAELHDIPASSAIIVALLYAERVDVPQGFGFLAQQPESGAHPALLAATFLHQKYPHSTPAGGMTLRVFFGGAAVAGIGSWDDNAIAQLAQSELRKILPQLPGPAHHILRRWPHSLPQYEIGHAARVARIRELAAKFPGLLLAGNAYNGVGLPDMVRDARAAIAALENAA